MSTHQKVKDQEKYRSIGLFDGHGATKQSKHGATIVYARTSMDELMNMVHKNGNKDFIPIFLLGPTPPFFGENKATTSWRRELVQYLDQEPEIDDRFWFILPEPENCDWKEVDFPGLEGKEHIYAQLHWEDYLINMAAVTGILVLHAHFRWDGNAGPTTRFEAGKLFALMKQDLLNACVINYPDETESAQYIDAHLLDATDLLKKGRFALTNCAPDAMTPFFDEIVKMARNVAK